jgi:hypothetical protein
MRHLGASRHPFIAVAVLAVAGASAVILGFVLVVNLVLVPLGNEIGRAPGQLAHAYSAYWDGVGQQFEQACEQTRGPDCKQYWGTP